jgi:hypothetical protein
MPGSRPSGVEREHEYRFREGKHRSDAVAIPDLAGGAGHLFKHLEPGSPYRPCR